MTKALDEAFAFYLSYHSNHVNQLIHIVCVWPILFTAQILLQYTPSFTSIPLVQSYAPVLTTIPIALNLNVLFTLKYASYYAIIEQPGVAGIIASMLVIMGYFFSTYILKIYENVWQLALFIHIFCWAAQIYGHKVHEKRQPAFMDNIQQALVVAPLFVLMEVMCDGFGYKAEFKKKMQAIADKNIKEYKASLAKRE